MISSFSVCLKYHWQHTSSPNIYRYIFLICLLLSFTKPAFSQFKQLHVEANENSHIHRVDFYAGDLYFGNVNDPPLFKSDLPFNANIVYYPVPVENGKTYFWRVVTKDANGNTSTSPLFQFNNR